MLGPGDLWYKDAIIYSLNVETFQDSDGDGVGDFADFLRVAPGVPLDGHGCRWLRDGGRAP